MLKLVVYFNKQNQRALLHHIPYKLLLSHSYIKTCFVAKKPRNNETFQNPRQNLPKLRFHTDLRLGGNNSASSQIVYLACIVLHSPTFWDLASKLAILHFIKSLVLQITCAF